MTMVRVLAYRMINMEGMMELMMADNTGETAEDDDEHVK